MGYKSIADLIGGEHPDASLVGIGLNIVALAVMVPVAVAVAEHRTGRQLDNQAVIAQSKETWISNYPAAALVAVVAAKAGADSWCEAGEHHPEPAAAREDLSGGISVRTRGRDSEQNSRGPAAAP